MKPAPFDYYAATSLREALELKAELGSGAALLAGGQSLVPMLNMRLARPEAVIDLNRVPGLDDVRAEGDDVHVGAMVRHRALERSDVAFRACPLLRESIRCVGHAIVRNRGTVGGSIAHADPAAELPAVLAALGGHVTVASIDGERVIGAGDLFTFHFTTSLRDHELLTEIVFPSTNGAGWAFDEISRRHGDYALAGAACVVTDQVVRIAFLGVGSRPILVETDDAEQAAAAVEPADDVHATAEYRRELVRVLTERVVARARRRLEQRQR